METGGILVNAVLEYVHAYNQMLVWAWTSLVDIDQPVRGERGWKLLGRSNYWAGLGWGIKMLTALTKFNRCLSITPFIKNIPNKIHVYVRSIRDWSYYSLP